MERKKKHIRGEVDYIDYVEPNKMSLIIMDTIEKMLGFQDFIGFYYRIPGSEDDEGLVFMAKYNYNGRNDFDVSLNGQNDGEQIDNVRLDDERESSKDQSLYDSDYDMSRGDGMTCVEKIDHEVEWGTIKANEKEKNDRELEVKDLSDDLHSLCSNDDKNKGLLPTVYDLLPQVELRYCVRHMYNSFKKIHNVQKMLEKLKDESRACTGAHARDKKFEIRGIYCSRYPVDVEKKTCSCRRWDLTGCRRNPEAYVHKYYCKDIPAKAEKKRGRTLAYKVCGKDGHNTLTCPSQKKHRVEGQRALSNLHVPIKMLEKLEDESRACIGAYVGDEEFEVRDIYGSKYSVDIEKKTCSCRRWHLTGVSCIHRVCAIRGFRRNLEDMYIKAYEHIIKPVLKNGD
ncbi:hypothetical protein CDL12_02744 [Handroanthus impetiginosus]|uniref:SWIM-type domain-containing protein n=1 Tax=Handroanthus impetiginosus TaxID=429701 RepID=A0A2G9I449_9LAMI|nr:hypothetical protein CDL12_02744 [Handroanthus impetiginosus]